MITIKTCNSSKNKSNTEFYRLHFLYLFYLVLCADKSVFQKVKLLFQNFMFCQVKTILVKSSFQLSVDSNVGLLFFSFTLPSDWSRKLAPFSKPIRLKTNTSYILVTCIFPPLRHFTWFSFCLLIILVLVLGQLSVIWKVLTWDSCPAFW